MGMYFKLLIFSLLCASFAQPAAFRQESEQASRFLQSHLPIIDSITQKLERPQGRVLAIVYPELLRFNLLRNLLETVAVEQLYSRYGSRAADFSIGPFQMKPSFVEELEHQIRQSPELLSCYAPYVRYPQQTAVELRTERLRRLKQFNWQVLYACLFDAVVEHCFGEGNFSDELDELAFFATAYNCGIQQGVEYIESWIDKRSFPYGHQFGNEQYNYASLSKHFFEKIYPFILLK